MYRYYCLSLCVAGLTLFAGTLNQVEAQSSNPIVLENQRPGTAAWQIPWGAAATDAGGQIKGYASVVSVNKGDPITLNISVNPAQNYTIDVYRLGWYQGLGGRLMQHIGPLTGVPQAACPTDAATGMIACQWAPSYILTTETSWTDGVYLARLTNSQGYQNYIVFTLRDDSRIAALYYQEPVTTYQAYNNYPDDGITGKSLYAFNSYGVNTVSGGKNAVKVSFDRPYEGNGANSDNSNSFFEWEFPLIRWMEANGYDVTYATDIDTHVNGTRLLNYGGILAAGHDQYWTKPVYDSLIAARDSGINFAFFGAGADNWQARLEPSTSGILNRVLVCYRYADLDPIADPALKTVQWMDTALMRSQTSLVVRSTPGDANASLYQAPSGAWVFVTGAARWGWAFDNSSGADPIVARIWQTTANVLNFFVNRFSKTVSVSGQAADPGRSADYTARTAQIVLSAMASPSGVSFDNAVSSQFQWNTTQITTPAFLVGSGANRAAMIMLAMTATTATNITASLGGVSGTLIPGTDSGTSSIFRTLVFCVPNPPSGMQNATVSWTTSMNADVGVITVTGADPSTPCTNGTFAGMSTFSSTPLSLTVNSNPGDLTASIGASSDSLTTPYTNQTLKWGIDSSLVGGDIGPGTGTAIHTWTGSDSGRAVSGANFKAAAAPPDFTLSASPPSQSVAQGTSASYSLTITPYGGFTGQVNLSITGLPAGSTASFSPNPATASSTLSVSSSATTPLGSYMLTITGVSGSLTHSATVSLGVNHPGVNFDNTISSGFQWNTTQITTPPLLVGSGANRAAMIMVAMTATTATNINASLGGVSGTLIPGTDSGTSSIFRTLVFCVANPPSGMQNAAVSWTTNMNADVGVITVSGADPSTPCTNGTFAGTSTYSSGPLSVTINSNPGDLTASVGASSDSLTTPYTNQTLKWGIDSSAIGGDIGAGTGITTHTWTGAGSGRAVSGANFKGPSPGDFTLIGSPQSQSVPQGASATYNLTITPSGGFTDQVNLSVAGLPGGATGGFSPNPATASSTLSITTSTTTPAGSYALTVTGSSASGTLTHTAAISLVVTVPDFTLNASPSSQTVTPGNSASYNLAITPSGGFTNQVSFTVSGLPTGATATFTPNPATALSTLSANTTASTPAGSYTLTINAVSGSLTHTATVSLMVSDFTLAVAPTTQTVAAGNSSSYNLTITPRSGFTGQVSFSVTGLPTGAAATFTPNPATTSSTLSVNTSAGTPPGFYTLSISGVSLNLTHTAAVSFAVSPPGVSFDNAVQSGFQWNTTQIITPSFLVGSGANRAAMIMLAMTATTATNINASLGGVTGTLIPGTDSGTSSMVRTLIFCVANPPSGMQTATASWTTGMNADVGVITVSGADPSTPCTNGTFAGMGTFSSGPLSVTINSNPGDLTASIGASSDTLTPPYTNQTLKWGIDSSAIGGDIGPGNGTTTHTWTGAGSGRTVSGANFKAAASLATYTETFTGTNGATPAGWTNLQNAMVIQNNQATGGTAFNDNIAVYTGAAFRYDQFSKVTIQAFDARNAVIVRSPGNPSSPHDGYLFFTDGQAGASHTYLAKYFEGTPTVLQNIDTTFSIGDVMELRATGTTLRVYKNSVQVGTDIADGIFQNGYTGLLVHGNVARVSNWTGGELDDTSVNTVDAHFDFETSTDGTLIDATIANNSVHPTPAWGTVGLYAPLPGSRISTLGQKSLGGTVTVAGSKYSDLTGTRGLQVNHTVDSEYIRYSFPTPMTAVSTGFWVNTGLPLTGYTGHSMLLFAGPGTEYSVFYLLPQNLPYIQVGLETFSGLTTQPGVQINQNTWYWVSLLYDATNQVAKLALFDSSFNQIGATVTRPLSAPAPKATWIGIGQHTGHGDDPAAFTYYDNVLVDWTRATFPLLPR